MRKHAVCPECGSHETEAVHVEWYEIYVERVRVCKVCPTEWTVSYGDPQVMDVKHHA